MRDSNRSNVSSNFNKSSGACFSCQNLFNAASMLSDNIFSPVSRSPGLSNATVPTSSQYRYNSCNQIVQSRKTVLHFVWLTAFVKDVLVQSSFSKLDVCTFYPSNVFRETGESHSLLRHISVISVKNCIIRCGTVCCSSDETRDARLVVAIFHKLIILNTSVVRYFLQILAVSN